MSYQNGSDPSILIGADLFVSVVIATMQFATITDQITPIVLAPVEATDPEEGVIESHLVRLYFTRDFTPLT